MKLKPEERRFHLWGNTTYLKAFLALKNTSLEQESVQGQGLKQGVLNLEWGR